jgi:2-polyprenyl-3-methyl-5-hydroxy-6-metoxy-1,4-benzoquinol methylase
MKIYNKLEIKENNVILDGSKYPAVVSKHSVWIPDLEAKIILSLNGLIESVRWQFGRNKEKIETHSFYCENNFSTEALRSIINEYTIFDILGDMSPKPKDFIYIKTVISDIFYPNYADPFGMYGFFIEDAMKLSPGNYSFERFRNDFIKTGKIIASPGALGDLEKKAGNLINGYLVDVRRTIWDMMQCATMNYDVAHLNYQQDRVKIIQQLNVAGQFPPKERSQAYQTYYMRDLGWQPGSRDTIYRFNKMKVSQNLKDKSILDLGSQLGSMSTETFLRGARNIVGVEYDTNFLACARDLARYNSFPLNFIEGNLMETDKTLKLIKKCFSRPVDVVFALSLTKHIKPEILQNLLARFAWRECYVEGHNCNGNLDTPHCKDIINKIIKNWRHEFLGFTEDRSIRPVWRLY